MATTIVLKRDAECADCGAALSTGTVVRWYRDGRVYGLTCHGRAASSPRSAYDRGENRSPGGRCEDAPCCGCC